MATEEYQSNCRGARRYQFDEEARRKRAANNVYRFRRIKWGEPTKLKVLAEDLEPRQHTYRFPLIVAALMAVTFGVAYVASDLIMYGRSRLTDLM